MSKRGWIQEGGPFVTIPTWVGHAVSPAALKVYFALAERANKDGICWPAVPTMCDDSGLSERTLKRAIQELKDTGVVIIQRRRLDNNANASNIYTLRVVPPDHILTHPGVEDAPTMDADLHPGGAQNCIPNHIQENQMQKNQNSMGGRAKRDHPANDPWDEDLPKNGKPKPDFTADAVAVIEALNAATGRAFSTKPESSSVAQAVKRLKAGATKDDLCLIIRYKAWEWMGGEMAKHLRPETLFRPCHHDDYLTLAKEWENGAAPVATVRKPTKPIQGVDYRYDTAIENGETVMVTLDCVTGGPFNAEAWFEARSLPYPGEKRWMR